MLILAVDTSQILSSIALIKDGNLISGKVGSISASHSESIMPLIDDLLVRNEMTIKDIDFFAVGVGPGSFTGVRIGMATLKTLAQVLKKNVVPFSSLEALFFSAYKEYSPGCFALANAYQGLVFAGAYTDNIFTETAVSAKDFAEKYSVLKEHRYCGSGAFLYENIIREECGKSGCRVLLSPIENIMPEGVSRAVNKLIAMNGLEKCKREYSELSANYLRPSQAEINLQNRLQK